MSKKRAVNVVTKCVADCYAAPNERIVEFYDTNGQGGLISFRILNDDNGTLIINVYNASDNVKVVCRKSLEWKETISV